MKMLAPLTIYNVAQVSESMTKDNQNVNACPFVWTKKQEQLAEIWKSITLEKNRAKKTKVRLIHSSNKT
jgi:hypothetical protein